MPSFRGVEAVIGERPQYVNLTWPQRDAGVPFVSRPGRLSRWTERISTILTIHGHSPFSQFNTEQVRYLAQLSDMDVYTPPESLGWQRQFAVGTMAASFCSFDRLF